MSRMMTIDVDDAKTTRTNILVRKAEALRLTVTPSSIPLAFTISDTQAGDPVVEIPSTSGGSFVEITPNKIETLTEGLIYWYNIWDMTNELEPVLLFEGRFDYHATVQPDGADYASQVFADGTVIVTLSQAEYDALPAPDLNTIYMVI